MIDTNIYSALDKGVVSAVDAVNGHSHIIVSFVTIAELRYGFLAGNQKPENEKRLQKFLSNPAVEVVYSTSKTADIYSSLAILCRQSGRAVSHNDLWITALAIENDVTLVTYDQDFSVFADTLGKNLIVLND